MNTDWLRMTVVSHDDRFIYGTVESLGGAVKVFYDTCHQGMEACRWSYLAALLQPGCRLNLIRPRIRGDVIVPELIIYEPDYLVNISEVAACFQPCGPSVLYRLRHRISPDMLTEAILLGNLAGQLLDEEVNIPAERRRYSESVRKFFRRNAFSMIAADISRDFHENGRRQQQYITAAFAELPWKVKGFDKRQVVLEPSFFSPMLGLQGRIDLMQLDMKFLMEQKSGKAAFPEPAPDCHPRQQEAHYVQLLLYMTVLRYNYRKQYEGNGGVAAFLLYSKYPKGLCSVGIDEALVFEALKIRNTIAYTDRLFAHDGYAVLERLTPDRFRTRSGNDMLWHRYIYPQLAALLQPLQHASDLERRYFHSMMKFVANEHIIAKVGTDSATGFASIWLDSTETKRAAGNIYHGLALASPTPDHIGEVKDVTLTFGVDDDNAMQNFRKGDIVILYPYKPDSQPDACTTMVIRCSVADITAADITLSLRATQSDARVFTHFADCLWAIEHDFMEASFTPLYRGVYAFLSAHRCRRDLLLMRRRPETDCSVALNGDYGSFNDLALRVKRARDIFLIIGPPGTGKTSYGMLNTLKEQLTEPGTSVLITSYTNRAVDEICSKLVADGIDFIRVGNSITADAAYADRFPDALIGEDTTLDSLRTDILDARVVVGTTAALCANTAIFTLKSFDLAIVDEASQILEPHLLPILSAMHGSSPAVGKVVMIGDHKQLPAVVQQDEKTSRVTDPILNAIGLSDCRLSLFERFLSRYGSDRNVTYMLTHQGRMHREIAEFPNMAFYGGRLQVVPLEHQCRALESCREWPEAAGASAFIATRRVSFISVTDMDSRLAAAEAPSLKVNTAEADVIASIVAGIYRMQPQAFSASDTIGIIVPYRNQIAAVRRAIADCGIPALDDITIDTVERYQGSQRDNIIFGFTVKHPEQLDFLTSNTFVEDGAVIDRKLNVAMTRARERLILVGNAPLLSTVPLYCRLIDYLCDRNALHQV